MKSPDIDTFTGEFGIPRYDLLINTQALTPLGRDHWQRGENFDMYQQRNRSSLARAVAQNVGHNTPRGHHVTRHGNRR
ncbi:hypothetical protein A3C59_02160 [Candidatus Daviesbacteria bacterium RIFCSPHIGHO2_02_FULL_36_13]|uniref:Uncharacterized protein n=1 Tax=Candidatus Daviesbacteria bacterium RIFCSPHIGHO2_02_FULL_36_13 TaxID=1797768 RepID=A0A1F5JRZ0_9BACT|nr:MAG: hypothetical protein A3C59_02160 [Candidatus Daviesbacteria bacterium RIFCSPHIGHO2_02_FULL_36_13]OGE42229.1 MAG: hypothetical protein A3A45_01955 [Candidatus Daviesbacteria bacterium RIFCSPLOWO2_01_FULL_36_8]